MTLARFAVDYSYNSTYPVTTAGPSHGAPAFPIIVLVILVSLVVLLAAVELIALWKVFTKAGHPGWAAIIPLYNTWLVAEMAGKPGWWGLYPLISVVPVVGWIGTLVMSILIGMGLARNFGRSELFGVFGLGLFGFIGYPILAFSSAIYKADRNSEGRTDEPPYPRIAAEPEAPSAGDTDGDKPAE